MDVRRQGGRRGIAVTGSTRVVVFAMLALVAGPGVASAVADPPAVTIDSPPSGSYTASQTPEIAGSTNDVVDPVTLVIHAGASAGGETVQTLSTLLPPLEGTWTLTPSTPLPVGTYTAVAEQTNLTFETGASSPVTFTVDTTAPEVTLAPVASPSNDATPVLTGTAGTDAGDETTVGVRIYAGASTAGEALASASVPVASGAWSYTAPHLADGTYTAQATQSDAAGNEGSSAAVTFVVDTSAPEVTLAPVPSPSNDASPRLEGEAGTAAGDDASVTVTVYAGSSAGGEAVASESVAVVGTAWSFTPSHLADGEYTAKATQGDASGNEGASAPVTFTIDTVAPDVTLDSVASRIADATPKLKGEAGTSAGDAAHVTVTVYRGTTTGGSVATADEASVSDGKWSFTPSRLPDGTYTAEATQSDAAGNEGVSSAVTFTIDTTAPEVTLAPVASPTDDATPKLEGEAGTSAGDAANVTVTVYRGSTTGGSVAAADEVPVASGGKWSFTPSHLADGTYTAQAAQRDSIGNTSVSAPVTFTVDTVSPSVTLATPADGSFLNTSKPTFTGSAGTAPGDDTTVSVEIYAGNSVSGAPAQTVQVARSGGSWSTGSSGPQLPNGTYTVRARQTDAAGNEGVSVPSHTFTIKTDAPTVTLDSIPRFTTDTTPSFSGRADTGDGDGTVVTLKIYDGSSASGAPVREETVPVNAGKWTAGPVPRLRDGIYTAQAEQTDAAEHVGVSATVTFTVDTTAPAVSIDTPTSPTDDATPVLTGPAGELEGDGATVAVKIHSGASAAGSVVAAESVPVIAGVWTFQAPHLADGEYTAQVVQSDAAGNVGTSAAATFTVDTVSPAVTLASPENGSSTEAESQLVKGAAGTATGDGSAIAVELFTGASIGEGQTPLEAITVQRSGATWSTTFGGLAVGAYTVRAEQSDRAGNLGVSAASTFEVREPGPVTTTTTTTTTTPPPASATVPQSPAPPKQPPTAAFAWFPTAPHTGESVSLASSSTDVDSAIVAYAWDVAGSGTFTPGGPVIATSFATPGAHVVRLRVTDADGLSSDVAHTISVSSPAPVLMQPFPVVRITGSNTRTGARLSLLTVQAPVGARVTVSCRGRGCPAGSMTRTATLRNGHGTGGTVLVGFPRFERSLRAGVVLEVRVYKPAQIGKYTRFVIRRGKPPSRFDECLSHETLRPIACPKS